MCPGSTTAKLALADRYSLVKSLQQLDQLHLALLQRVDRLRVLLHHRQKGFQIALLVNEPPMRLVELATGEFHDDWVTARQRRAFAAADVIAAEELAEKIKKALKRADEHLDEMAQQFPGPEQRPEVLEIRKRIAALRPLGAHRRVPAVAVPSGPKQPPKRPEGPK